MLRLGIMPAEWEMLSMAALFLPAVSVIVTRLATKEGVRDLYLGPNFSRPAPSFGLGVRGK